MHSREPRTLECPTTVRAARTTALTPSGERQQGERGRVLTAPPIADIAEATPDGRDVASNCAVSIRGKDVARSRIEREARASQLLRAGLQPDRHLDALLVTHHGDPYRGADLIVVETTLQPRHAVDRLAVHGNDDVSGNNRPARFGP